MLNVYHNLSVLLGTKGRRDEGELASNDRFTPATRQYYFRYERRSGPFPCPSGHLRGFLPRHTTPNPAIPFD